MVSALWVSCMIKFVIASTVTMFFFLVYNEIIVEMNTLVEMNIGMYRVYEMPIIKLSTVEVY